MKKSSLAMLALATFSGAAAAQSSVTVFGLLDLSVQYLKSGDQSPLKGGSMTRLADGHVYGPGSRLGFRTSEDLGDGLRANVLLEMGVLGDTGGLAQGGRAFGRQAFASLSSQTLGEVRLGRQYMLHDELTAWTNPYGNTMAFNPTAQANTTTTANVPLFIDAPRADNSIQYVSPVVSGFRLIAMGALGEGTTDRYEGIKVLYSKPALNVGVLYEQSKARLATPGVAAAGDPVNKIFELAANYDFGPVQLFGGYQKATKLTTGSGGNPITGGVGTQLTSLTLPGLTGPATGLTAYTLGASTPIGVAASVAVNYTRSKFDNSTGDVTLGRLALGGFYAFSKQTMVYASVGFHNGDLKDRINEKTILMAGIRKSF